jgi:predicted phosphodiesterase
VRVITKKIEYKSRKDRFNIIGLGDTHLGSVGFDEKHLLSIVDWIKHEPRTYWIGMGDYCECINPTDKRFDPYSISPSYNIRSLSRLINMQIEDITALLIPIKKKCLGLVTGNHEETVRLKFNNDIGWTLAKNLGVENLGYDGWIRLCFSRQGGTRVCYEIYVTHGHCGAGKSGAKVNKLEDIANFMDADIIMMGHGHKKVIAPPVLKIGLDNVGNVTSRKQIAVMTGSFLRTYVENATTYGEKAGYSPCDLGVVKIMLKPDTKDCHASL